MRATAFQRHRQRRSLVKSKLDFIAAAVVSGFVEGGEVRAGAYSWGGREARLLGMGHRHTGHDVFLWVLSHDDVLSTVCSCADLFSGDQLLSLKPCLVVCHLGSSGDPVALEIRSSIPECLETFSQRSGRRKEAWMIAGMAARFASRRTPR